jgi:O-antigen/teichoic acid export membrane protein
MTTSLPSIFASRVAGVFATKVGTFGLSLIATFLLARFLGPSGRGAYTLILLIPTTLLILGQLGIPSALIYYAGRGRDLNELRSAAVLLLPILSLATIIPTLLLADTIQRSILIGAPAGGLELVLLGVPFLFLATLGGTILLGRQAIRTVNLLALGQTATSLVLLFILVGPLGLGVQGAITTYVVIVIATGVATLIAVLRLAPMRFVISRRMLSDLLNYGIRIYPGSLASFFSYRIDVFLISLLLASSASVGLYGLAVSLAELVFYVPDSIATAFFPRIANAEREEADLLAPQVTRVATLATMLAAAALIPVAFIGVHLLLPAFVDSLPALIVIVPGIIALSISKVLSGYVSGLGRALPVGAIAVATLVVNVIANLILIPAWGIVGAAAASLVSYTANATLMIIISARLARVSPLQLILPRPDDLWRLRSMSVDLVQHLFDRYVPRPGPR